MDDAKGLPFLTRNMLAFQQGKPFGLEVTVIARDTYLLTLKGITKEGPFEYKMSLAGDYTEETFKFRLPDVPIFLTIDQQTAGYSFKYAKVNVYLTINDSKYACLLQGNLTGSDTLSWPNVLPLTEPQKRGSFDLPLSITDPAAGAEIALTVPANEWWRLKAICFTLVTSADVANRRVYLKLTSSNGGPIYIATNVTQTAGQTKKYTFFEGAVLIEDQVNNIIQSPLPLDIMLPPGAFINTITSGLVAADDFGFPYVTAEIHSQKAV